VALFAAFVPAAPALAQDATEKPVVLVSLSGYRSLLDDADFLAELAGNPKVSEQAEGAIKLFTGGKGLEGLDQTRPWGAVVKTDGLEFNALIFLPVTSTKKLLDVVAPLAGAGAAESIGDNLWSLEINGMPIFVKESSGWAFIAQSQEDLGSLPADPTKWLGSMPKDYDIGVSVMVQNVPELYKNMALDQMKTGVEATLQEKQDGESDEQFEARKQLAQAQLANMERSFNEADTITIGWKCDASAKNTHLDIAVTGVRGSKLADEMATSFTQTSRFGSIAGMSDAMAVVHFAQKLTEDNKAQIAEAMAGARQQAMKQIEDSEDLDSEEGRAVAKQVAGELLDAFERTAKSGVLNGAMAMSSDGELNVVGAMVVADAPKLEALVRDLVAKIKAEEPDAAEFKLDSGKRAGVNLHEITVELHDNEEAAKLFGEHLVIRVGFGKDLLVFAFGPDAKPMFEAAIDGAAKAPAKIDMQGIKVSVGRVMAFAATMTEDEDVAERIKDIAAALKGKDDEASLLLSPIPNGARYRFLIDASVIEAAGAAAKAAQGGN
jgi:hypothetical protein